MLTENLKLETSNSLRKPIILPADESWLESIGDNALFQEKSDGDWAKGGLPIGPHLLNAEKMSVLPNCSRQAGACRHNYVVNDLIVCDGQDVRRLPLTERWAELQRIARTFPANVTLCETGKGVEFYRSIIERSGEGVVAKVWGGFFGEEAYKVKRSQVFYCRVTALDASTGGVWLADRDTGEPRGKMPLRTKFDRVRGGSILKVEAFGLTSKGLLREARPDKDSENSWLVSL